MSTEHPSSSQIIADNVGDILAGTQTAPEVLALASVSAHLNVNPSSTRTSLTRVDQDEEARQRQGISQNLDTVPAALAPPQQDLVDDTCNPTSAVEELQEELPSPPPTTTPQEQGVTTSERPDAVEESVPQTPQTYVTFLLISGRRRTMAFEPDTPIGRVKELAWNSWPIDWQSERPPAPSYLRVLYLGRMLQDDEALSALKLPISSPTSAIPTIMHLSIRPSPPPGEGDGMKKKKRRGQSDASGSNEANEAVDSAGCCRCIIC